MLSELRSRRAEEEQRPLDVLEPGFEQVEEGLLRPMQVLDEHDRGSAPRRAPRGRRPTPGAADPVPPADADRPVPPAPASCRGSRARRADRAQSRPNRSAAARNAPGRSHRAPCTRSRGHTADSGPRAGAVGGAAASHCENSRMSVVFPTPTPPMIVTRRGCASSTTRPYARSSASSSSRGRRRRGAGPRSLGA